MAESESYCVVSLAAGGLYGPFRDETSARAWASREFAGCVWNVLPLAKVDTDDSHVGVFATRTFSGDGPTFYARAASA